MRRAKMPYRQKVGDDHRVRMPVPKDIRGRFKRDGRIVQTVTQTVGASTPREYDEKSPPFIADIKREFDAFRASERLASDPLLSGLMSFLESPEAELVRTALEQVSADDDAVDAELARHMEFAKGRRDVREAERLALEANPAFGATNSRLREAAAIIGAKSPAMQDAFWSKLLAAGINEPPSVEGVITLEQAIEDYADDHGPWRDERAKKKAIGAKERAARSLFEAAGTTNMAAIRDIQIHAWKEKTRKEDERAAHDMTSHVKKLYSCLEGQMRFKALGLVNPAAEITVPRKPDHDERNEFTDTQAAEIVAAALASDDPLIKWGHLIMCHTGAIISEFVNAPTDEIYQIEGEWFWHLGKSRKLKTGNRPRKIPLHPALRDAGFLEFVQSCTTPTLFDVNDTVASNELMAFLRDPNGLNIQDDKLVNYSWRHRFISTMVAHKVEPSLRRYFEGHPSGIDEEYYIHHRMPEMVAAIAHVGV